MPPHAQRIVEEAGRAHRAPADEFGQGGGDGEDIDEIISHAHGHIVAYQRGLVDLEIHALPGNHGPSSPLAGISEENEIEEEAGREVNKEDGDSTLSLPMGGGTSTMDRASESTYRRNSDAPGDGFGLWGRVVEDGRPPG